MSHTSAPPVCPSNKPERLLGRFAAHAEVRGDRVVRNETVLAWASQSASPQQKRKRLQLVRELAVYLHAEDERHEIPPPRRPRPRNASPYAAKAPVASQIRQVMNAGAGTAAHRPPSRQWLSITPSGCLRRPDCDARKLPVFTLEDVTSEGLRIRNAKSNRARLVPLHESVQTALDRYLQVRLRCPAPSDHLFVLASGRPLSPDYLTHTYVRLARQLGLRGGPGAPGPRLHDLRQ